MHKRKSKADISAELQEANVRIRDLEEVQDLARIGKWELNLKKKQFIVAWQIIKLLRLDANVSLRGVFRLMNKDSQIKLTQAIRTAITKCAGFDVELQLYVDFQHIWIRCLGRPQTRKGKVEIITGVIQDISKEKEVAIHLKHHQQGLRTLNSIAANINLSFDEQINLALQAATNYLGLSLGIVNQLHDKEFELLYFYNSNAQFSVTKGMRWPQKDTYCHLTHKHKDALVIPSFSLSEFADYSCYRIFRFEAYIGAPIVIEGKSFGIISFFSPEPIKEKFMAENLEFTRLLARWIGSTLERAKKEQEIILAKKQAEEASMAKAQFLSTMSHEIRTPMNAVIGLSHLLLQSNPRPDQIENLQALRFSGENLLALINDILDFSKIEAGKIDLEHIDFNLLQLLKGIRQSLSYNAEEKGLSFVLQVDETIPALLVGDPTRLSQVLNNLLSNAIKFTEKGSIRLEVGIRKRTADRIFLNFAVADTGIGIASENLERIFDSFTQASTDTTRKYGGTGLGLAITKKLLELQKSRIHIKSKIGAGSRFYFTMPFDISRQTPLHTDTTPRAQAQGKLQGSRILLVEDNNMNVIVARQFLTKWQVEFDHAENGKVAVEKTGTAQYDLILMDLQMPVMDGYEAARLIRQRHPHIPIIALSASAMLEIQDRVYKVGMNDFITKPFNPEELYNKLSRHLARERQHTEKG